jgi:dTDP-4-amino-4,6-dideoxygalactose transaminase/serine acetyltransferase
LVILPGYTCVVVPDAIIYCRAKPVYVDIDPNTLNIDVSKIEEKITPRTKVLYAQHTFGSFCNMEAIMKIARKYNLKVVEDCAHAVGAEYDGKKAGTFGDAAYFTTEQSKILSTGMGGMAITNDKEIAARIREIQAKSEFYDEKIIKKIASQIVLYNILYHPLIRFIGKYGLSVLSKLNFFIQSTTEEEMKGKRPEKYPVRLSNIQAKVGLSQLRSITQNLEHRRKIAMFYKEALKKLNHKIPEDNDRLYNPTYIRYWLIVDDREKLKKLFQSEEIELGEWFNCPIHPKETSLKNVFYKIGSCPIAEYMTEHNINLPTHLKVSIRYRYYKKRLKYLGKNVQIDIGVYIQNPEYVSIGDNTWIDKYVILLAGPPRGNRETRIKENKNFKLDKGNLFIGQNVHIAPFCIISGMGGIYIGNDVGFSSSCKVYSFTHHYRSFVNSSNQMITFGPQVPQERQSMILGPIVVEDNVGIALNCVVLPGVTIHKNSFIMMKSVVSRDILENSIASGNPARIIKNRFEDVKILSQ